MPARASPLLLVGITRNHAFLQGNKRTAFISAETFLDFNGYTLKIIDLPILGETLERMIEGKIPEEDFHLAFRI